MGWYDVSKPNLSKGDQKAMEETAKRKDIIIINAAKGDAVVIMNVEKYINEANSQLSDKRNYKMLYKKIQRYNTVIWLATQLAGLKKKTYFLNNWLTDWKASIQKPLKYTFHQKYIKKIIQEDQW